MLFEDISQTEAFLPLEALKPFRKFLLQITFYLVGGEKRSTCVELGMLFQNNEITK